MVGPAPTKDTATWLWIPGDYLLGALVQVDKAVPFEGPQMQQFGAVMSELGPLAVKADGAQHELMTAAVATLTPKQVRDLTTNRDAIVKIAVDADALVATLKSRAAGAAPAKSPAAESGEEGFPFVSPYFLAALTWLEKDGTEKLTPEQAATLAPLIQNLAEQRKSLATIYPRIEKMLNEKQVAVFVQTLVDMHGGKGVATMKYPEVVAYFKNRAGGK